MTHGSSKWGMDSFPRGAAGGTVHMNNESEEDVKWII
jgi:hypothetical protein